MRTILASIVCVLLIGTAFATSATNIPATIKNGYYEGRSGNILVQPTTMERDMVALFVDKSDRSYFEASAQDTVSAFNVADVVTRSLGLSPVNTAYTPDFVKMDLFDRPQANVLVAVEGLGANVVQQLHLPHLKRLGAATTASLVYNSYPHSAVSLAASLASGTPAAQHGIVAPSWETEEGRVEAFGAEGQAAVPNVADVLADTFPESLIVTASADPKLAAAYCPHTVTPSHFCMALAGQDFKPLTAGSDALFASGAALRRAISEGDSVFASLPTSVAVSAHAATPEQVTVSYVAAGRKQQAEFNLNTPQDYALFAELQYLATVADQLSQGSLAKSVRDESPDLFAFTLASLTGIAEYGTDSPKYQAAASLIDATLPVILARFSALYNGRLVAEVLLLGSPETAQQPAPLASAVSAALPTLTAHVNYPSIYVTAPAAQISQACEKLQAAMPETQVYCFPEARRASSNFQNLNVHFSTLAAAAPTNSSSFTDDDIQRYQIAMWFSIVFAIVLIYVLYSAAFMEFRKDTLLYGTFNPHWEDRKKH